MVKKALVVALFTGLVIGLAIGYAFFEVMPQEGYWVSLQGLQDRIAELEQQISDLDNDRIEQITALLSQLNEKDDQVQELQEQVDDLIAQIANLNQSYQELQADYEDLLNDYNMLNAPISNFTSVGDLDFTIATHQHIYSYKDPFSGNVTIYYHNGTAFKGTFSIAIKQVGGPGGSGWSSEVNGYGDFYVKPPAFLYGPGTYRIGLCTLWDSEGYMIATSNEIGHIYVTVEAK